MSADRSETGTKRTDIQRVDTFATALVMASLGRDLTAPDVLDHLDRSPKETADELVDVLLRGLAR